MSANPEGEFIDLKYHFVWNAINRKSIFRKNIFDLVYDAFYRSGDSIGELVNLLWIAPDHIHLYVKTDGKRSVGWIVKEVKRVSQQIILNEQSITIDKSELKNNIWDEA